MVTMLEADKSEAFKLNKHTVKKHWDKKVTDLLNYKTVPKWEEIIILDDGKFSEGAKFKFVCIDRTSSNTYDRCQTEVKFMSKYQNYELVLIIQFIGLNQDEGHYILYEKYN